MIECHQVGWVRDGTLAKSHSVRKLRSLVPTVVRGAPFYWSITRVQLLCSLVYAQRIGRYEQIPYVSAVMRRKEKYTLF